MTLSINISVPAENGPYEAHVTAGKMNYYLKPGDALQLTVWHGLDVGVVEVPQGTAARIAQEALDKANAESQDKVEEKPAGEDKVVGAHTEELVDEAPTDSEQPPADAPVATQAAKSSKK